MTQTIEYPYLVKGYLPNIGGYMHFLRILFAVMSLAVVSGCVGTGAQVPGTSGAQIGFDNMPANPSPIANSASYIINDDSGKTFRAYFSQAIDGATITDVAKLTAGIVKVHYVDVDNIEVTTTSGKVIKYAFSYTQPGGSAWATDVFKEVGGSGQLTMTSFFDGQRWGSLNVPAAGGAGAISNNYYFGHVTNPKFFATATGTATYAGSASGYLVEANGLNKAELMSGSTQLIVDFSNSRVIGDVFSGQTQSYSYYLTLSIDAAISGNEFRDKNAWPSYFAGPGNIVAASGYKFDVAGEFIGQGASSAIGSFTGTILASDQYFRNHNYNIVGSFSGDLQ